MIIVEGWLTIIIETHKITEVKPTSLQQNSHTTHVSAYLNVYSSFVALQMADFLFQYIFFSISLLVFLLKKLKFFLFLIVAIPARTNKHAVGLLIIPNKHLLMPLQT